MRWLAPDQIATARAAGDVIEAIQSYPTLLDASGGVPVPLRQRGLGVDIDIATGAWPSASWTTAGCSSR